MTMIPSKEPHPTGTGPSGKPWAPTADDPLCACGEPKHTHIAGTGGSTENLTCPGFVAGPPIAVLPVAPVA